VTAIFLHEHSDFPGLLRIIKEETGILAHLVEKDYWIMHCLHGLQQFGFTFALKGGTSLSKGHQIIDRFSEDIDILIEPPPNRDVKIGRNQNSRPQIQTRKDFYDWLSQTIEIGGISKVERDTAFDDLPDYRSAGIRLNYISVSEPMRGLREGVLLEVGFDTVAPNTPRDISSWAYDHAASKVDIVDNRAKTVPCYDAGYTFVEKLQTVSTKFRNQQAEASQPVDHPERLKNANTVRAGIRQQRRSLLCGQTDVWADTHPAQKMDRKALDAENLPQWKTISFSQPFTSEAGGNCRPCESRRPGRLPRCRTSDPDLSAARSCGSPANDRCRYCR
jgi:hypothetical protein